MTASYRRGGVHVAMDTREIPTRVRPVVFCCAVIRIAGHDAGETPCRIAS